MKIKLIQTALIIVTSLFITACGEVESEVISDQPATNTPKKALAGAWTGDLELYQEDINTTCDYNNLTIKFYEISGSTNVRGSLISDKEDWKSTQRAKGCIELINQTFQGTFDNNLLSFTLDLDGLPINLQTTLNSYLLNGSLADSNTSNYTLSLENFELKDTLQTLDPDLSGGGVIKGCTVAPDAVAGDLTGDWTGLINNLSCYYKLSIEIGGITIVGAELIPEISNAQCPASLSSLGIDYTPSDDEVNFTIDVDNNRSNTLNFVGSYNSQNMCGNAIHTYNGVEDSDWIWSVSKK